MESFAAWRDGVRRVWRAPASTAGVWILTVVVVAPAAAALGMAIRGHLGQSLAADQAADTIDHHWWEEFSSDASGPASTFETSILGFAAPLKNLSDVADGRPVAPPLIAIVVLFLVVQVFLTGGLIERFARDRRLGSYAFLAACGAYFGRLLRLWTIALVVYAALLASVRPGLHSLYARLTVDFTVERRGFAVYAILTLAYALLLAGANVISDFAKIRLVAEDRLSAFGALVASLRFILRQPGAVIGLYLINVTAFAVLLAAYALLAPSPAVSGLRLAVAVAGMQLFILARVWCRLVFLASETALFQSRLAHAHYAARQPSPRPIPAAVDM